MPSRAHVLAYPEVKSIIVGQYLVLWIDPVVYHVFIGV
tara:strand:- start:145 stop:258 length:114 start_codon:yes stop_codon:yes gene_type:complete